ncbi:histidine kinase dimerization/phosphoacceptor domain -containing protein [Larkinella terrae]|uniref:histidine kinase n=1 Tax=Larkinella terrae TaxID=2025311 RepID=A0A7K0EEH0_9BACT|nr:histidine kinase dimerization/phosphoacceptor domain -containing protein [Larkinella terrae]MRS60224.1 hypothetical protein [Larkinella terrae]
MKRSLIFLLISGLSLVHYAHAQSGVELNRSKEINQVKRELQISKFDTNQARLLLKLALIYLYKPDEQASDLDTTLKLIRQVYAISRHLHYTKGLGNAYLFGAQAHRENGNSKLGRKFAQMALTIFTRISADAEKAMAYLEVSRSYGISQEEFPFRIQNHEKALLLFQKTGNREREAVTLKELGEFENLSGFRTKALLHLKQSLAIYQVIGDARVQEVYCLLGQVSSKLGDFRSGVNYGLLALKTAEAVEDTTMLLCTIYNHLGITYHLSKDSKAATNCFKSALRIAQQYHDIPTIQLLTGNLTSTSSDYAQNIRLLKSLERHSSPLDKELQFMIYTRLVGNYSKLRQFNWAQFYCDRFEKLRQELGNHDKLGYVTLYLNVIFFYIDTHQYRKAHSLLDDLIESSKTNHYTSFHIALYQAWFKLDSAQRDYPSAIAHYQRYSFLKDSVLTETKNQDIARFQVEFETSQKEQQLLLKEKNIQLLTNRNQVQQATLERNALQRNSTIGGAVLLLLLLGLTYNRYRLKQRTNRQLEAKQFLIDQKNQVLQQVVEEKENLLEEKEELLEEREWMLREIHHRVKNNLQVISSMLHSQVEFLHDPVALATLRESQNRVQVMALIHQKLYQTDNLAQIGMRDYIHQIVEYLIESFDRQKTVRTVCEIADVNFDVSLATPLGLIINEALTNSLKYAFPQNRHGTVWVILAALENQTYRLTLRDDGIGLPADFDVACSNTLGLTMIRGLSRQIEADLSIKQLGGVEVNLILKEQ